MKKHNTKKPKPRQRSRSKPLNKAVRVAARPIILPANRTQARRATLDPKHKGFTCPKCGYPAHKLTKLTHCPLCVTCDHCGFSVRNCKCREGE